MSKNIVLKNYGFSLYKLLALIAIIGCLAMALSAVFIFFKMNNRDAARLENITEIKRALDAYFKDSSTGYPASTGECLNAGSGVGAELKAAKLLLVVPLDPLWPEVLPLNLSGGLAVTPAKNFCYYYYSAAMEQYKISYFLETNSKSGAAGINTITQ
jgi:type II secretory pathway pseudopilin PulG